MDESDGNIGCENEDSPNLASKEVYLTDSPNGVRVAGKLHQLNQKDTKVNISEFDEYTAKLPSHAYPVSECDLSHHI
jgi:hypothetical protein